MLENLNSDCNFLSFLKKLKIKIKKTKKHRHMYTHEFAQIKFDSEQSDNIH